MEGAVKLELATVGLPVLMPVHPVVSPAVFVAKHCCSVALYAFATE